jgi:hypothetical protein
MSIISALVPYPLFLVLVTWPFGQDTTHVCNMHRCGTLTMQHLVAIRDVRQRKQTAMLEHHVVSHQQLGKVGKEFITVALLCRSHYISEVLWATHSSRPGWDRNTTPFLDFPTLLGAFFLHFSSKFRFCT